MRKEDFMDASSSSSKMKLKIGDRVRFLNSVGGGVITAFHGKNQVLVEDENGFDVPALMAECVVVGEADRRMENKEPEPYLPAATRTAAAEKVTPTETKPVFEDTPQGERLNLNLAFLPVTPEKFMQSAFEAYLINESNYHLYFTYMSCKNHSWISRCHGLIEPDTKIFMEAFEKPAVNELEHICLQAIAFKEGKCFSLKNVLSIELRLDTVKFYKLHCFTKNDFFNEDALILPLVLNDKSEKQRLVSVTDIQEAIFIRKNEERRAPKTVVGKTTPTDETMEVDLHINRLLDTTSGMSHADILNYQLSKFHETMKTHSSKKGWKIIFIHGKGNGVLRTAIEKELKTTYKQNARFRDASFREYGFGATMVIIR